MFKLENIVVTNGTTHCKLKQGKKTVFQFKYFNWIYKNFLYIYEKQQEGITFIKFKMYNDRICDNILQKKYNKKNV